MVERAQKDQEEDMNALVLLVTKASHVKVFYIIMSS